MNARPDENAARPPLSKYDLDQHKERLQEIVEQGADMQDERLIDDTLWELAEVLGQDLNDPKTHDNYIDDLRGLMLNFLEVTREARGQR